jgi:hypothetical protein
MELEHLFADAFAASSKAYNQTVCRLTEWLQRLERSEQEPSTERQQPIGHASEAERLIAVIIQKVEEKERTIRFQQARIDKLERELGRLTV